MITIIKPGLLTSIQDLGRYGYQKYGVIASGVMDPIAHRVANLLVGNEENESTIEMTLIGPTIQFHQDTLIAICGGDLSPAINGKPIGLWRPIFVKKGSELAFGKCQAGCRAYLAVAGGFSIQSVMESKSTYLRAEIGGYKGRAFKKGDVIHLGQPSELSSKMVQAYKSHLSSDFFSDAWTVDAGFIPIYQKKSAIRVLQGRHYHLFSKESHKKLYTEGFEVSPQSDRMGYRLMGPSLTLEKPEEMISEAVAFGTIQVPPGGDSIILLADRQTTGGYPKIAQVATVDLPFLAQAKPGDQLHFTEITHDEAQRLILERERELQALKQGIQLKFA
ncbi:biotin-dependent carboxyltransferase family protein [Cytobacillus purgationiresistens]|uniref:Antagonist of KipI n=1 Tax=Cytobacillus purgationiresistens TaxID=863449 RepID=A0ABU0AKT9_9BACI|nr:biotin-dependent carboxyltransferase family protein [Cytobacillus purgationiresistens]MDQ0271887.1 antagonist of KipI [Cytobacillus purgationiresistens]